MSFCDKGQINFSDDSTIPCGERGKTCIGGETYISLSNTGPVILHKQ